MDLKATIQNETKAAMKERNTVKVDVLRMLSAEIKKREIDAKAPLDTQAIYAAIQTLVKQRQESTEAFLKGGRQDLADKEQKEVEVLRTLLPQALSDDELKALVAETATAEGATSPKDMGKVVKAVLAKAAGRADGKRVSQAVQAHLSGK